MGRRIKDRSWGLEEFANSPYGLRLVEPSGDYLFFEKLENFRDSGFEKRRSPDLFKVVLNEDGTHSINLQKEDPGIFGASWAAAMDYRQKPPRQPFAENTWGDSMHPLYGPSHRDHRYESPALIPRLSIDDGSHVLAAIRASELFVRPISERGDIEEIDLEWPKRFRRNYHSDPPWALGTLHSEDTYAIIFEGKRVINVFRRGDQLTLNLNFGKVDGPAQLKWSSAHALGTESPSLWMGFTDDGSRLLTVSYLPYWTEDAGWRWSHERRTAFLESFRWKVKSWDIDGRVAEMARTKLRLEGKWKAESERKERSSGLVAAGLPGHVAGLMALHEISDEDGIALFRHLRQGGVPAAPSSEEDPLARIDEMAFTGAIGREDARFLVENRQHAELVNAIAETDLDVDYARWLLVGRGFSDHPDAVRRVMGGASVDTVAKVEGIERGVPLAPAAESPAAERGSSDTEDEESENEWDDEWFSSEPIL